MYRIFGTTLLAAGLLLAAFGTVSGQIAVKIAVPFAAVPVASSTTTSTTASQSGSGDEALLRSVGISTDGPGLLQYFRLRTQGEGQAGTARRSHRTTG